MRKRVVGLGLTIITAIVMFVLAIATLIVPVSVNAETVSAENSTSSQTATVAEVGQSTEVSSPSGTLGTGVALDEAEGSYIYFDLTNLNAKNSIVIKLYSGSTLLANTNLKKTEYLAYSALSAKVCITTTSSSWETEWLEDKIYNLVPDSAELYVDNVKVSTTNTINMYNTDRPQEAREWFEVDGVTALADMYYNGNVKKFKSLQSALDFAKENAGDYEIKLNVNVSEDVIIHQVEGVNYTINGNDKVYSGTMTIYGYARYTGAESLTIKNVNFSTSEKSHYFIDSNSTDSDKRYAHNVTVEDCSFTATGNAVNTAAAMRIRQGFNVSIVNVTSDGLHSILQGYGISGVTVDGLTITSGKNAVSLGTSTNAVISNSSINVDGYGIRADGTGEYGMTLEGNNISANLPVVVRNATGNYTVTVNNGNTFNAGNENSYAITFTSGDDGTFETPTGEVQLTGSGADSLEIYGITAKINGVNYTTLQKAIDNAKDGDVITLMSDTSEDVTIVQNADVDIVLDGNGNIYSGTIKIDGDARYYATETLTIKNFKFVTAENSHDFIAANASYIGKNYNYAHNVTITKCSFDYVGTEVTNAVVAMRIRQGHGIIVENVTANNIHSLIQGYGIESVKFDTININNAKEGGISLGTSFDVTINKAYVSGAQYGIRADGNADNSDTDLSVTNSEFNAQFPVVVRSATGNYSLIVENNTYNASNTNGYEIVFTKGAVGTYETPTGDVKLVGNISDSAVFGVVVKVNDTNYFQNIEDAVAYANENGGTITLLNNIELVGKSLNIASDKAIKLDLNGYNLVGTPTEQKAYAVIINNGNLTITGNGEICCNHNLAGSTGYAVNTILNAGTLVIDGATIINTSTSTNQIGYAIDNNSTSNNAILIINNGIITASGSYYYDGIRLFANSITNENSVTVKGGTISSIWLQNPSDSSSTERNNKDVKGSVTVEGGEIDNLWLEPSSNFKASVKGGYIGNIEYFETSENRNLVRFISGGTFGIEIPEPLWAAGYVVIPQGNVYVTITMAEFAEIVADEIREEVEIRLTQKVYSVAGENSFENIVLEAIDRIGQLDYVSEINRVMLWVNEAFDKVLTEYECQELIVEYAIKAKDYAELKKVDFNDQRIIDAFTEMSNYALKLEMQLVLANVYDVIDTIAQENALALQNAKDNAILELMGANGENANNVTSSMIASINVCNTIEQVESALVVAKAELSEIITYKGYIKNASEKANQLATTLSDVSSKLATIESTLNTKFQGLSNMINEANNVISQIKSSTDSIIANAATKAELQTKLDEINTAISKVTSDVIAYVKDNVLTEISKLSEEITKISEKAQQAAEKALEAANSVKDLPATLTSVNTAVAEAKEAAAKATEEATKIANLVDSLNQNITNGTNSIDAAKLAADKAAQAAEQAAQAAVKAEEAAKIAAENAQTTEVKAHAVVSETELKTWLEDYLGELQNAVQPIGLYSASTEQTTDTFREELIEKLALTYSKENADLILSYYDQAIAQINASTSKEEINYALAIFKSNVSLVDSLVTLAPTPQYNDSALVTLLKVVIIIEGVIVLITFIALILVIKFKKKGGNGGDDGDNNVSESLAIEDSSANDNTVVTFTEEIQEEADANEQSNSGLKINAGEIKTFEERLKDAEVVVKQGYETIRENLLSYKKVNARISKKAVSFRKGRKLLCKMTIVGKTLRAYLALDPNAYEVSKYFQKDVSGIKAYEEVPMLMRVRSGRAIKRVCNLITELEKANELIKKPEPKQ